MNSQVVASKVDIDEKSISSILFLLQISELDKSKVSGGKFSFPAMYQAMSNFSPYFSQQSFRSKYAIEFVEKIHEHDSTFNIKQGSHLINNVVYLLYALVEGSPEERRQSILIAKRMRLVGVDYLRLKYLLLALGYDEEIVLNFLSYFDNEQAWAVVEGVFKDIADRHHHEPTRASFIDFYTNQLTRYPSSQVHYPIAKKKDSLVSLLNKIGFKDALEIKKIKKVSDKVENVVFFISRSFNKGKPLETNSHYTSLKIFLKLIHALNESSGYSIKAHFVVTMERFQSSGGLLNVADYRDERDFSYFIFEELRKECKSLVSFYMPSERCNTINERLKSVLNWMQELTDANLVFLGGSFDSPSLRRCAYQEYPITLLPTTSNLTTAYGALDDYFDSVRAITPHHLENIKLSGVKHNRVIHFPKPMYQEDFEDTQKAAFKTWRELGLEAVNSSNVLLTPLTGSRVVGWMKSVPEEIIEQLVHALERFESQWVIVGLNIESFEAYARTQPVINRAYNENRIILVPFTDSLVDVIYNSSTIFVPTQGAGTTLAKAVLLNKLVLVPDGSDAQSIICEDLIFNDSQQAVDKLEMLLCGENTHRLAKNNAALIQYRFDTSLISKEFYSLLRQASLNFNEKVMENV